MSAIQMVKGVSSKEIQKREWQIERLEDIRFGNEFYPVSNCIFLLIKLEPSYVCLRGSCVGNIVLTCKIFTCATSVGKKILVNGRG
jgi:hypothetical protein